ncbi:cell wall metabolism sensor histidine kinase WalK [Alkalihalobacillus sp. BA299]|uniref:sensor histidine kinase n=1 Tax=Alkalihalobacillus sp. BA299 TaxID=2815938 RepID=UPI001ADD230E|nr:HAMP domain-containing sensor histidine kinase [Alkalihalobacillus sp. BA299]
MRLSSKLTMLLVICLMTTILTMSITFYIQSKEFYQDHLTKQLEHRLVTHADSIENHFVIDTILHVLKMEKDDTVNFLLFDEKLTPLVMAQPIDPELIEAYHLWIKQKINTESLHVDIKQPITDYVTTREHHIQHIWSMQPVYVNERVKGYLFIDQNMREFEATKNNILQLVFIMSIIIFVIGLLFILYLSRVLTKPLQNMGKATTQIAKGNFEYEIKTTAKDEVGRLAQDIQQMSDQLKRYNDTRKEFLSHISHDLRTPLTYVKAYAALLKDREESDSMCKKQASMIYKQAKNMEVLVNDLFELAKYEEGNIQLHKDVVNLYSWLHDLKLDFDLKLQQENIEFELEIENKLSTGYFDKEKMKQVIKNLIENSIRYTQNGKIIVRIQKNNQKKRLSIAIQDNGLGIPESELPFIWERFYRVDKSRTSKNGGSGLGLAIVKHIIELHGGTINVDSKLGEGTTFLIMLPQQTVEKKDGLGEYEID